MSWWITPTTADVGLRAFEPHMHTLFRTVLQGMQSMIINKEIPNVTNQVIKTNEIMISEINPKSDLKVTNEQALVKLLEEALYDAEVNERWWTDVQINPEWFVTKHNYLHILVSWIPLESIEQIIHIKAVTRHSLIVEKIESEETRSDPTGVGPDFIGPGFQANVIFDV